MTDERRALLDAIIASPEDDTVRLVYADWLEEHANDGEECGHCLGKGYEPFECEVCGYTTREHGEVEHGRGCYVIDSDGGGVEFVDECGACNGTGRVSNGYAERAEFIRVQCELAELGPREPTYDPQSVVELNVYSRRDARNNRRSELFSRESILIRHDWFFAKGWIDGTAIRRGFIESVEWSVALWLAHGPSICLEHPVQRLRLTDCDTQPINYDHENRELVYAGIQWRSVRIREVDFHSLTSGDERVELVRYRIGQDAIMWARSQKV